MATYNVGKYVFYDEDGMRDAVEDLAARMHLSIINLAEAAEINRGTIERWLRGEHTIKYDTLSKILKVLFAESEGMLA